MVGSVEGIKTPDLIGWLLYDAEDRGHGSRCVCLIAEADNTFWLVRERHA